MTKTNTRSRIVSILLVLAMLLTMVPITGVTANAADTSWTTVNTYDQLKAALSNQNPPDNIKLGSDIDTGTLTSGMGILESLEVKGRKQLDLNGHTLRMYTAKTAMNDMFMINHGSLTVLDSSSDQKGTILGSTYTDSCYLINVHTYGKFTLDSGTLKVDAGSLTNETKWKRVIHCYAGGTVTINGGTLHVAPETYEGKNNAYGQYFEKEYGDLVNGHCGYTLMAANSCKVTITGGTFEGPVRLDAGGNDWKENEPRIQINGGTFEKKVMLNGPGDGTKPLAEINGGTFLEYVQAWVAASFENSFSTSEVVINGGEFSKKFWLRPKFVDKNDKDLTGYHVAAKLNGGTFHKTLSVDKQSSDYGHAPVRPRLSYSDVTFLADEMLGKNAVQTGKGTFAALDTSSYREYIPYYDYNKTGRWSEGFVFEIKAVNNQPTKILSNAWGMKSVTLDGNPIDYFKDWKGTVERMDNSTAHTIKFEWYPLATELAGAGYSYNARCDRYISGNNTPTTDTISATDTEYSFTIPKGADPKVYSFDLHLNLKKDGSSVGIFSNEHIVKLVVSEAPVVEPDPTLDGTVYYTSGIVYGSPISISASVTPAEATKAYQWQRSTDGGSTWTNIEGATSGRYTPVAADMGENVRIRMKVTAEGYLGEIVGAPVKVSKAANNNYPEAIKLKAVKNGAGNYTGFEITNFDSDCEYVYSTTDTPNWSANQITSATVTGLTSDTTYYVFARFKETATHTAGSIVSKNSIRLYDYVPLERVLLEGYGSSGTIYIKKGESVTLKVSADPSNANSWKEITFKDEGATTSNIAISNGKINASTGTATPFPNGHTITITGVSKGSANLRASYSSATSSAYGTWYVVVYDDSTVANALRLESVYAYEDITLSENDTAELPTNLPKLLPENSGYHLEWRIIKSGITGFAHLTENDNIKLEDGKIKPKAAHTGSEKTQLELVAVKDGSDTYRTLPKTSHFSVTVTEAPVIELTGVTVAPTKVNLELNATYQLSAVKEPVNAAGSLNWESSNPGVATVDSTGKVTAKAQGTAIITVSCGDKKDTCTVTVDHQHDYTGQPYLYLDPGNHYQECKAGDGYNIQAHEFTPWTDNGNGTHSRHCTVCKMTDGSTYTETAEHTYGTDWKYDDTNHWHECECGDKADIAAHSASEWIIDTAATETAEGAKHKECTVCKKVLETATIPATGSSHTHSYGTDWKYDDTNHWHECECGDKADIAAHSASEWIIDTAATETAEGAKHKECTVCKKVLETATIPATGSSHTHSYGTDWKYDDTNHWHECECGDKADIAAHSASEWIIDTAATETAEGAKHKECTVCKKVLETATIPATGSSHTHSYGTDWKYDDTNHWHECECGDKADIAAHSASEWIIDTAATETAEAAKHKECTVCKKVLETATIPATGSSHTHSYGVYVGMTYTAGNFIYQITSIDTATLGQSKVIGVVAAEKNKITEVTIPDRADCKGYGLNVTTIGNNAFAGCKALEKLTIGNKVTVIGKNAFKKCSKLKTVVIGKAVKTISSKAFIGDNKIKKITFKGDKLKTVKKNAFSKKAKKNIKSKKTKLKGNKKAIKLFKKKLKIK